MNYRDFIPKYIRETVADVAKKVVSKDYWNGLWNRVIEQGDWNAEALQDVCTNLRDTQDKTNTHIALKNNPHQVTAAQVGAYTKSEIDRFLQGGDTIRHIESFTIVNPNNGDGTFYYSDSAGETHLGTCTMEGYQVFDLQKGTYVVDSDCIEIIVNDTLHRSKASGGLQEPSSTQVMLTAVEGADSEITVVYFERVGIMNTNVVVIGGTQPAIQALWLEDVDPILIPNDPPGGPYIPA